MLLVDQQCYIFFETVVTSSVYYSYHSMTSTLIHALWFWILFTLLFYREKHGRDDFIMQNCEAVAEIKW